MIITYTDGANVFQGQAPDDLTPYHLTLCCSTCGKEWGRIWTDKKPGPATYWHFESVPCVKHTYKGVADYGKVPGSFLIKGIWAKDMALMWRAAAADYMPQELLERELLLNIQYLEHRHAQTQTEATAA